MPYAEDPPVIRLKSRSSSSKQPIRSSVFRGIVAEMHSLILVLMLIVALALPASAVSLDYRVHAGDVLSVQVFGEQSLSQPTTVLPDGSIVYPLIGRQDIAGKTIQEVNAQITSAVRAYVHDPIVNVSVTSEGMLNVLVLGNVKTPGKFSMSPESRLTDAIAAAGGLGPTDRAYPSARLSIGARVLQTISLERLLREGDLSLNVPLENNTVVYVPSPNLIRVRVLGAVDKPGEITIGEGDRLSMAIAGAGNSSASNGDLNHVHITRTQANGTVAGFEVNLYRELQQGDLHSDPVLQKDDIVYVPQARRHNDAGVGILGAMRQVFFPFLP
jgi:polysaccharide biosynthesis/export protein